MGKAWSKLSGITKLSILIFIGGLIYALMPEGSPPKGPKPPAALAVKKSSNADEIVYTEADQRASFASLSQPLKNSFKPLVVRTNGPGGQVSGKDNAVPAYMARGDGNWIYSGTASIDGVPTALLENGSTGEGVYLKDGERWKDLTVLAINPDSISIRGAESGEELTLRLASPTTEEDMKPANPAPALQGPIGNMTISPLGAGGAPGGAPGITTVQTGTVAAPAAPARAGG